MKTIGMNAKEAAQTTSLLSNHEKNKALKAVAKAIIDQSEFIKSENQKDIEAAKDTKLSPAMIDRLILDDGRIQSMAQGLLDICSFDDPIGETLETFSPENGLLVKKVSVPLGVIGIIYESRPNVTIDAFGLCFKSGNTAILKGGKEAIHSNIALGDIVRDTLTALKIDPNALQVIKSTDRETTTEMMKMNDYIDVLIPRGSQGLIQAALKHSTIPVIETGAGNCHVYVDKDANLEMALQIIENAKCQRVGVCNAMESLVVHKDIAPKLLPLLYENLKGVDFYADKDAKALVLEFKSAREEDYSKEYLSLAMSVKTVSSIEEAIKHINEHNTKHSEAIITDSQEHADKFTREVDSSTVYVNASTRFTDGSEFGFGAEIGISTQKLHARGPMGLKQLTSYKYIVKGKGQTRV